MGITQDQADQIVRLATAGDLVALSELVSTLVTDDENSFYGYVECQGCGRPCDTLDNGTSARLVLEGWRWVDQDFTTAICPDCGAEETSGIRPSRPGDIPGSTAV